MAYVKEARGSRSQDKENASLEFTVHECTSETEAIGLALAHAPGMYNSLYYLNYDYAPINKNTHRVIVRYDVNGANSENRPRWRFATTGGTTRVKRSLLTVGNYSPYGTPPNYYGRIGVTDNGIEGVDIVSPNRTYSESHTKQLGVVTAAYAHLLGAMTGTINQSTFRAWATGEVLFCGASMQSRGREGIGIDYEFLISPNATNIVHGDVVVPFKLGWDYLWYRYYEGFNETTGRVEEIPLSGHVERVYPLADFSALLI